MGKACFLPPITAAPAAITRANDAQVIDVASRFASRRPPMKPPSAMDAEKTVMVID